MRDGAMRGIGWTALYQDPVSGQLMNMWIGEHDGGHPAGGTLLMIMDVFEHAFMLDYGLKRPDYIEAFFKAIDWSVKPAQYAVERNTKRRTSIARDSASSPAVRSRFPSCSLPRLK